ncbi:MAG TPA: hypothetical protein PLZ15_09190 [Melioribacteraceae bacterium]|nr:hypothetical protein [Melioribacteraceae bacterium]
MRDINIPLTKAEKLILSRIDELEAKLNLLIAFDIKSSLEEVSLWRAAKILHKSSDFIEKAVLMGELKCLKYKDKNGNMRYRFRVSDLLEWQKLREMSGETFGTRFLKSIGTNIDP